MTATVTPFRVGRHPYLLGRWAHLIDLTDCRRRGWFMLTRSGEVAFGAWRTRRAAVRAANRLQRESRGYRLTRSAGV